MRPSFMRPAVGFCAAVLALAATIEAATVTWSSPTNVSGDTDVITIGTLVAARNFAEHQLPTTVNGVLFDPFAITNGGNAIFGIPGVANFGFNNMESSDTAYGSTSAPYSALSTSYQTLLSSGAGSSTGPTLTLTLLGLTNGVSYLFQWWSNDSGLAYGGVNSTTATATNAVTLDENTTNAVGGMGQWATGTFTASGTTQAITISGARPEINAFQLRVVPEPGAFVLCAIAGVGLACFRNRRRA